MTRTSAVLGLWLLAPAAWALSFEDRVAEARELEADPAVSAYLNQVMLPAVGTALQAAMVECAAKAGGQAAGFTLVADVDEEGRFIDVVVKPSHSMASCFSNRLASLTAPAHEVEDLRVIPVIFQMEQSL